LVNGCFTLKFRQFQGCFQYFSQFLLCKFLYRTRYHISNKFFYFWYLINIIVRVSICVPSVPID
jgi:hypothetical protein